jgi:DNA invertase Pin-like site-specific DNA recombinase|tara:strand:- start:1332 stop:2099 length:768 start_codon:yes stop_codon:yes gene_type:complete
MEFRIPKPVAIYTRKSSSGDSKQAKSHERQRNEILTFCKAHGMVVIKEFSDTRSAFMKSAKDRKGFMSMLDWLNSNADYTCVMTEVSRLSRQSSVWELIEQNLKQFRFVELGNEEPNELVVGIFLHQARAESSKISARVKSAYDLKKEQFGEGNFDWGNPNISDHGDKGRERQTEKMREWWEPILIMDAHLYKLVELNQSQRVIQLNSMGTKTRTRMVKGTEVKGKPITAQNLCRAHKQLGTGGVKELAKKVVKK